MIHRLIKLNKINKILILLALDFLITFTTSVFAIFLVYEEFFKLNPAQLFYSFFTSIILVLFLFFFGFYKKILRFSLPDLFGDLMKPFIFFTLIVTIILSNFNYFIVPRSLIVTQPLISFFLIVVLRNIIFFLYYNSKLNFNYKKKFLIIGDDLNMLSNFIDKVNSSDKLIKILDLSQNNDSRTLKSCEIISKENVYKTNFDTVYYIWNKKNIKNFKFYFEFFLNFETIFHTVEFKNSEFIFNQNVLEKLNLLLNFSTRLPILESTLKTYRNKIIIITGAGGSIGSEISKQLFLSNCKKIILLDNTEENLFKIYEELNKMKMKKKFKKIEIVTKLVSVLDKKKLEKCFEEHLPDILFHAAAYKHVNLSELNYLEAIENNFYGTKNVVDFSIKYDLKKFILISTDKAVKPSTVMGYSKQLSEIYVNLKSKRNKITKFSTVRFGNVLNSSGSVLPIFKNQIETSKEITITHQKVMRYFMLIEDAVSLVLKSGSIAKNGDIMILNMGKQIKILSIAKLLIKLYGKTFISNSNSNQNFIKIKKIGLRTGEKMQEELHHNAVVQKTPDKKIFKIKESYEIYKNYNEKKLISLVKKISIKKDYYSIRKSLDGN